jgi:CheY-like chemotaxis protein
VRHILVVEDDSATRSMLVDLLQDGGYVVAEAIDGFQALKRLREHTPDLVVLDLMLPGMSGWEFIERSRERLEGAQTPVVVLSAIRGRGDYPAALGVAAWFTKPLDVLAFLEVVGQLIGPGHSLGDAQGMERPRRKRRLLVVEDEPIIRDLICEHLVEAGYCVDTAASVDQAATCVSGRQLDLIVLDLMLADSAGETFLARRRADLSLSAVPVVVVSAAPRGRLLNAKKLGADAFLSKPFDLDVLSTLVRDFVDTA